MRMFEIAGAGPTAAFVILASFAALAAAQPFQIVATVAPPGAVPVGQWKDVLRFSLTDSGSELTPLASIPNGQVFDPASVAFRTPSDLFIGNRHGNNVLPGSISRFQLTDGGTTATFVENFSQAGLIGMTEIAFNPITR